MKKLILLAVAGFAAFGLGVATLGTATASHVVAVTIDSVQRHGDGSVTVNGTATCDEGSVDNIDVSVTDGVENINAGSFSPCDDPSTTYDWSVTFAGPYAPQDTISVTATAECCISEVPGAFDSASAEFGFNNKGGNAGDNPCLNAGAGNGVEMVNEAGECITQSEPVDGGEQNPRDGDPGNSGGKNKVPATAPKS